mmetsp:Transcript_76277/g.223614  ORF Transcript_76277/g.223614 Transcript_76277/m.223614 type:complete len:207 (+) Transcript_76277:803-1423(+)
MPADVEMPAPQSTTIRVTFRSSMYLTMPFRSTLWRICPCASSPSSASSSEAALPSAGQAAAPLGTLTAVGSSSPLPFRSLQLPGFGCSAVVAAGAEVPPSALVAAASACGSPERRLLPVTSSGNLGGSTGFSGVEGDESGEAAGCLAETGPPTSAAFIVPLGFACSPAGGMPSSPWPAGSRGLATSGMAASDASLLMDTLKSARSH